jgi:hypothetical protein
MNWKELKEFCNRLPESELEKNVILWREDEAITDINAEQLEESYYFDPESDMGCFPESQAKLFITEDESAYPNGMDTFEKAYDKGHPILSENF